ncbi:cytochrome P450 4c21 [Halyomorpha halys]|uniref:cytochrome P450 4c21 n=1 Tax=Halyomorpha halys TaxID=286706 RepID=UPI0006D50B11|nr:cytochrome P450 4c21 [Halyomorpha halys]
MYGAYFDYFQGPFATLRSDDLWKIKRKEYNTFLKRSCVDNDFYTTFLKCSDKLINNMLASAAAADLHSLSLGLTQDISLETLFNFETNLVYHPEVTSVMIKMIEIGSIIGANSNILKAVSPILRPIMINLLIGKVAELRNSVLQTSKDSLLLNKSSPTGHPISTHIASRIEKDNGNDFILSNELHELFFTSAHTVGSTLGNAIIFLALLPDIQERAWKEQYEIFGNDKRDPNIDDLKQMHYLDRFIKEALRFLGPPYNGKLATADINVDGITIPRGTVVIYLMRYMRMDPENWKNPKAFDPDRFLEESDTLKYSFTPFGIGLRSCPGVYFATVLLKITLSKILRRLKLRPVQKDFRFEDIHYKCCIMTEVENPPLLQIEERI